ncbi:hypothetical protein [Alkalihalobacillus sp. LMS39]|uniref:hypothetical protein n=1 Tax=Alkalihalobacillus sp. LMS39 TaxID=2924032 RepID=UPI001FB232E5|nr:hypothetical protein [Alkalihalobacillus sp. LMS39]UOE92477.1 hypothetical protein MM271_14645 [Alkalihalobacillus sp. LMS39]
MTRKVCVCLFVVFFIMGSHVYAHKMLIEPTEQGVVKVHYEDGSFSARTVVSVYDKHETLLGEGKLDEHGYFSYDNIDGAYLLVADDGIGHRVEWIVGEERETTIFTENKWLVVSIVLIVLVGFASFFQRKALRKNENNETG